MCDGSARGWLAGDTHGLAGWLVTVGRVSVTGWPTHGKQA